jgi:hypothetical protein
MQASCHQSQDSFLASALPPALLPSPVIVPPPRAARQQAFDFLEHLLLGFDFPPLKPPRR